MQQQAESCNPPKITSANRNHLAVLSLFSDNVKIIIFILLLSLLQLLWFKPEYLIANFEGVAFINPSVEFNAAKYLWNDTGVYQTPGFNKYNATLISYGTFWHLLLKAGFSLPAIQKLWFIFNWFLAGLSFLYLLSVININDPKAKLVAITLYVINPFIAQEYTAILNHYTRIFLPLLTAIFIKFIDSQNSKDTYFYLSLWGITLFFTSHSWTNPPVAIPSYVFVPLLIVLTKLILRHNKLTELVGKCSMIFLVSVLVSIWWLYPFIYKILGGELLEYAKNSAQFTTSYQSSILDLFRLIKSDSFTSFHLVSDSYGHFYYNNPLMVIISFLPALIAFSALLLAKKTITNRYYLLVFSLIIILFLFMMKGNAEPFGFVYKFIINHVPGFFMFRIPYNKFIVPVVMSISCLLALSLDTIRDSSKISKK